MELRHAVHAGRRQAQRRGHRVGSPPVSSSCCAPADTSARASSLTSIDNVIETPGVQVRRFVHCPARIVADVGGLPNVRRSRRRRNGRTSPGPSSGTARRGPTASPKGCHASGLFWGHGHLLTWALLWSLRTAHATCLSPSRGSPLGGWVCATAADHSFARVGPEWKPSGRRQRATCRLTGWPGPTTRPHR